MKGIPGPYWFTYPGNMAKKELVRLILADRDVGGRMTQLRTDRVGGILAVTQVVDAEGTKSLPFLTIVAAPSVATFINHSVIMESCIRMFGKRRCLTDSTLD
jgi:hypothetical protein